MTKCKVRILKSPPKNYQMSDVARSLKQGKDSVCGAPKEYGAVLVKTRPRDGDAKSFPYHIWTKKGVD